MNDQTIPPRQKPSASETNASIHTAMAEEVTVWLIHGYANLLRDSPSSSPHEILESLVRHRFENRLEPEVLSQALERVHENPFVLETAVLILRHEDSWPSDPKTVFLALSEILLDILELAPELHIPWSVTARETVPQ